MSTINTLPFSTSRPWGMPPLSNEMNMPQLSLSMPQSQNTIPPIVVSRQTNRLLELGGNNHSYDADQLRNMKVPIKDTITRDSGMVSTSVSNEILTVFRQ